MTRFEPSPGLEQRLAQMLTRSISSLAETAAEGAKRAAPLDKVWLTRGDATVRPEHQAAHGQTVPENLRFTLATPEYDRYRYDAAPTQMGRYPRDEEGFTPGNVIECRCKTQLALGIRQHIEAQPATVAGSRVSAEVLVNHDLCVTAEFGTDQDQGVRYMAAGLREAVARLRPA